MCSGAVPVTFADFGRLQRPLGRGTAHSKFDKLRLDNTILLPEVHDAAQDLRDAADLGMRAGSIEQVYPPRLMLRLLAYREQRAVMAKFGASSFPFDPNTPRKSW